LVGNPHITPFSVFCPDCRSFDRNRIKGAPYRNEAVVLFVRRDEMFLLWLVLGACIVALSMFLWDWLSETLHRINRDK
jgi:hypothetical protein